METVIILGIAKNRVIGKDNRLPWDYPDDLRHFRAITKGHAIIMGRRTFESIGRPLSGRMNIVVSTTMRPPSDDSYAVCSSMEEALALAKRRGHAKAFLIGGSQLCATAMQDGRADTMILTEIKRAYDGDTYFPDVPEDKYQEVAREPHEEYDFVTYKRKSA